MAKGDACLDGDIKHRLLIAAEIVVTILAHGAAAIAVSLEIPDPGRHFGPNVVADRATNASFWLFGDAFHEAKRQ